MADASRIPARGGATRVRLFNGTTRRTSDWDGLRRDSKLWFDDADCLVYFYAENTSQRGASLRIPFGAVKLLKCKQLSVQQSRTQVEDCILEGTYTRLRKESDPHTSKYSLYVPAPPNCTREQAYAFHLTTRNLLAFAVGESVVGEKLSTALINLWTRMRDWKLAVQPADFSDYLEKQGYLDFTENTEHALACLKWAEEAKCRDVWIDAFVHCVGMHRRLDLSPEYPGISETTIALIIRKALEMDVHIDKITKATGMLLEDDFGPELCGLAKPAREHLDYFRSFLQTFYVNKFGWFPPPASVPWNKRPWTSMYNDFQHLYNYLADTSSTSDWTVNGTTNGGICVLQNVQSFDVRHGFKPLRHPLPLLPQSQQKQRPSMSRTSSLRPVGLGQRLPSYNRSASTQNLLAAANTSSNGVTRCPLVQEYKRFEQEKPEGKLDAMEARKVRWLLIYGILQTLTSIIKAPVEVRDPETPSYPLCASIAGLPQDWEVDEINLDDAPDPYTQFSTEKIVVPEALAELQGRPPSRVSIHPDCEADCAEDFFASLNGGVTRHDSGKKYSVPPSPPNRTSSLRNSMQFSVQALQKSVVGSLSRRGSNRRSTVNVDVPGARPERLELRKSKSVCEILVEDYDQATPRNEPVPSEAVQRELRKCPTKNPFLEFDFGFTLPPGLNTDLDTSQCQTIPLPDSPADTILSPIDSTFSTTSSGESTAAPSNRSSVVGDHADVESPTTDLSSWDGGSRRGSSASNSSAAFEFKAPKQQQRQLSYKPSRSIMNPWSSGRVHSGTYMPKGMVSKSSSTGSASSGGSSMFAEVSVEHVKAKAKAEEDKKVPKGRGRATRGMPGRAPVYADLL